MGLLAKNQMANPEHVEILKLGVAAWNEWRKKRYVPKPDLREIQAPGENLEGINFEGTQLQHTDLRETNLCGASLSQASLEHADLRRANVRGADLRGARLTNGKLDGAQLLGADLSVAVLDDASLVRANMNKARLISAQLRRADLTDALLKAATLLEADLTGADLTGCSVYGISAWEVKLTDAVQNRLVITDGTPAVTVDDLEVAQFVYLMLNNQKIRTVIDTITSKGVLILGRFYDERKAVLDAIRDRLRQMDFVPMVFDWDKPTDRDLTETVQLLASMSRFVVADVTDAKSIPQELAKIIPNLPSVPVRPIILTSEAPYAMFGDWSAFNSMLPVYRYKDQNHLIDNIEEALIKPVEQWEAGYDKTRALEEEVARLRAENAKLRGKSAE